MAFRNACAKCKKVLPKRDFLNCVNCKSKYDLDCAGVSYTRFNIMETHKKTAWKCIACYEKKIESSDFYTPARLISKTPSNQDFVGNMEIGEPTNCAGSLSDSVNITTRIKPTKPVIISNDNPSSSCSYTKRPEIIDYNMPLTLDNISKLLDEKLAPTSNFVSSIREMLRQDIKELVAVEVKSMVTTLMNDFSATTDFITSEQSDLKNKIAERDRKIEELQDESARVQRELSNIGNRLLAMEKISRDHNIEIQGVPESRSENLLMIFRKLCDTIATPIMDSDIRGFRRVAKMDASTNRPRNIIITLSSPRIRDSLLSAVHRFNKTQSKDMLSSRHLGLTEDSRRVYVVEHISPETKQIHATCRKFARDNNYKYVWVKYGQVFLRKDDNSNAVRVKSNAFLQSLH